MAEYDVTRSGYGYRVRGNQGFGESGRVAQGPQRTVLIERNLRNDRGDEPSAPTAYGNGRLPIVTMAMRRTGRIG